MLTQGGNTARAEAREPIFTEEMRVASAAARAAGQAVMSFYGSTATEYKSGASPVTAADRAANSIILRHLRERFPRDAILSEESNDSRARLGFERVWIVDPLDGTKEFLAQNGEFSVMIGLALHGRPVLGVVYLPEQDVLVHAAKGAGSWMENRSQTTRLACSVAADAPPRMIGSRSHAEPLLEEISHRLGSGGVTNCGSVGVKCSRIARGEHDVYVHPVPYLKEWDTCAPEVIITEAGGWVSDCRGDPLRYNKSDPVQPHGLLVLSPCCGEEVRATILAICSGERGH